MTSEEIKKALLCCSNPSDNSCKNCPYANNGKFSCREGEMFKDTLDLITEQEQEIERLKAENEKLKMYNDKLCQGIYWGNGKHFSNAIELEKEHAVKDFADKVKAKSYVNNYCREVVEIEKIDELLKEYEK